MVIFGQKGNRIAEDDNLSVKAVNRETKLEIQSDQGTELFYVSLNEKIMSQFTLSVP